MKKLYLSTIISSLLLLGCSGSGDSPEKTSDDGNEQSVVDNSCTVEQTNENLFDYLRNHYFWNLELPLKEDFLAENHQDIYSALDSLRVSQDRFSFAMTEEEYQSNYVVSKYFGFGFSHMVNETSDGLLIRFVYEDGSAAQNGLRRGDTIIQVGEYSGSQIISGIGNGTLSWEDVFGANEEGVSVTITYRKPDGSELETQLSKSEVTSNTVLAAQTLDIEANNETKKVGYLVFNSFRDISKNELNEAFDLFKIDAVDELILDLRYNGGGLVSVANQLSTQIAGTNVEDEVFVKYTYNSGNSDKNQTTLFALGDGIEQLNLENVTVLTTSGSCSSSELVINSLSPHINVTTIGDKTCGKPIGMNPTKICDHRVFAINFQTQNSDGYGDYFDGLPVTEGCSVADKVVDDWGSENDPLLSAGIQYLQTGSCPTQVGSLSNKRKTKRVKAEEIIRSLKGEDVL